MARPSAYKPEFAEQARKLCLMGTTDEQLAWFFDIDMADLAIWAWEVEDFYNAITPTVEERERFERERAAQLEARNAAKRRRLAQNPSARLANNIRARIWAVLKGHTSGRMLGRLGYSMDELRAHLESRFAPGMSWANYGRWHVDHIRPCDLFDLTDPEQFTACWALGNLQPLWAAENISKGAKYAGA